MTVKDFVRGITPSLQHYSEPHNAQDLCSIISGWVKLAGILAGLKAKIYGCSVKHGKDNICESGHNFVMIDNTIVDFTLSQFHPELPFPFVADKNSAEAKEIYCDFKSADNDWNWFEDVGYMDEGYVELKKSLKRMGVKKVKKSILKKYGLLDQFCAASSYI